MRNVVLFVFLCLFVCLSVCLHILNRDTPSPRLWSSCMMTWAARLLTCPPPVCTIMYHVHAALCWYVTNFSAFDLPQGGTTFANASKNTIGLFQLLI